MAFTASSPVSLPCVVFNQYIKYRMKKKRYYLFPFTSTLSSNSIQSLYTYIINHYHLFIPGVPSIQMHHTQGTQVHRNTLFTLISIQFIHVGSSSYSSITLNPKTLLFLWHNTKSMSWPSFLPPNAGHTCQRVFHLWLKVFVRTCRLVLCIIAIY